MLLRSKRKLSESAPAPKRQKQEKKEKAPKASKKGTKKDSKKDSKKESKKGAREEKKEASALVNFARHLPKAELHVHFEGSILPRTLLELAKRNKVKLPANNEAGLQKWFKFTDFGHFIEIYLKIVECLKTPDCFEYASYELGRNFADNNVRYAEVTFTIGLHYKTNKWEAVMAAVNKGRLRAKKDFGVDWGWIVDIPRNFPDTAQPTVDICIEAKERENIIALGLGGAEKEFPAKMFEKQFKQATAAGLASIPHGGEMDGAQSVWDCLKLLKAQRIGHGVRSIEDPELIAYLIKNEIPLEVCPTSNIQLHVYDSYENHPLRKLWDQGVPVTINSDDPPLFNTTLADEYECLVTHFGFTADELEKAALNSVKYSLAPKKTKTALNKQITAASKKLRKEFGL